MSRTLPPIRRVVIKIGSAVLAPGGRPDLHSFQRLADAIAAARRTTPGLEIILVSSGAVASGLGALTLDKPPKEICVKQAAAAIGQHKLMAAWARAMAPHELEVAQLLYTADDLDARDRFLNTRRTLLELLARGIVPIVNENDTVSFAEIKLGDNDRLSALTAGLVDADLLLILSSVSGVYEHGKSGVVIPRIDDLAAAAAHVQSSTSSVGTGGMGSKLSAAGTAASWGIPTIIAAGATPDILRRILAGEEIGTFIAARPESDRTRRARQRWLQSSARPKGTLRIDAGASRALTTRNASLLPGGIVRVEGEFTRGQPVEIASEQGKVIARGISAYSSAEVAAIAGKKASQIAGVLGYALCDEVVHRDDMVLV